MVIMSRLVIVMLLLSISVLAAQPVRVACIGNSITYGSGINNRQMDSYPGQLDQFLGPDYDVRNYGVSGRTLLKRGDNPIWNEPLFADALAFEADIVVILLGTNDSKPRNWQYKEDFVDDYIAMIDTFRAVNENVEIYACYPPPAFAIEWGIRDSVITTDIIPMIDSVRTQTNVNLIDFYIPFEEKSHLFPDAIHPSEAGSTEMAKVVLETLTGKTFSRIQDRNLARNAEVLAIFGETMVKTPEIVDGDPTTLWICDQSTNTYIVDLGENVTIDQFQLDFGDEYARYGPRYFIDVSADSSNWQQVVDQSLREDTTRLVIDNIDPISVRYIKLEVLGVYYNATIGVHMAEFRVMQHTGHPHAAVLWPKIDRISSRYVRYKLQIMPPVADSTSSWVLYDYDEETAEFNQRSGVRPFVHTSLRQNLRPDEMQRYYSTLYADSVMVISDTLELAWGPLTNIQSSPVSSLPHAFSLSPNFPNPFNPSTSLTFLLHRQASVQLIITNTRGQVVLQKKLGELRRGEHRFQWQPEQQQMQGMSSGVYFARFFVDGQPAASQKMLLLK